MQFQCIDMYMYYMYVCVSLSLSLHFSLFISLMNQCNGSIALDRINSNFTIVIIENVLLINKFSLTWYMWYVILYYKNFIIFLALLSSTRPKKFKPMFVWVGQSFNRMMNERMKSNSISYHSIETAKNSIAFVTILLKFRIAHAY